MKSDNVKRMGKVLRRANWLGWQMLEGEVFDQAEFDQFISDLHALCERFSPSTKQADIDRAFAEGGTP